MTASIAALPWFERHPRLTIGTVVLVASLLLAMGAEWMLARPSSSKLTIHSLGEERYIVLREVPPGTDFTQDFSDESDPTNPRLGEANPIVRFRADADGFVIPSRVHEEPDFSVVFIGGSTTLCRVVAEEKRFPYLAGRLLEQRTGRRVNAFNAARSGNDVPASINRFFNVVVPMRPQAAVLMHNINDLTQLLYQGSYWEGEERPKVDSFREYQGPWGDLHHNGGPFPHLQRSARAVLRRAFGRSAAERDEWAAVRSRTVAADSVRIEADFRSALETFVAISRTWGITPVLMTQQNRITGISEDHTPIPLSTREQFLRQGLSYALYQRLYTRLNEVTRDVARRHDVLLIDLDRGIPREAAYLYDIVHLNESGSERAATLISDALAPLVAPSPADSASTTP